MTRDPGSDLRDPLERQRGRVAREVSPWTLVLYLGLTLAMDAEAQSMQACPVMTAILHEALADVAALRRRIGPDSRESISLERTPDGNPTYEVHAVDYPDGSRLVWSRAVREGGILRAGGVVVDDIQLRARGVRLGNGVAVGDSKATVITMLGEPWKSAGSTLVYACDTMLLTLDFERERVVAVAWQYRF